MRKLIVMFLAAVAVASVRVPGFCLEAPASAKVTAYYFHGTFRCYTCTMLEKYSKEAIEARFKDALAAGTLEFKAVNVEERGNEHFVNEYQLYTKSLVISLVKDGKEVRSKNLVKIWDHVRDQKKFSDYVAFEVGQFLKDVK